MVSLTIDRISRAYGEQAVLRDVALDVANGEFVALVGPSGCGKSTLLRIVAGLERPTDGRILISGRDVTRLPAADRNIGMVFQSYALYPHMTVRENLTFALKLKRLPNVEIVARVDRVSKMLDIEQLLERHPRAISGGQRQRVAMGRAIAREPDVFLFDEPLSNLDANLRVRMRSEIKELHHRLENTMVYVTHDQMEAMTMADKIVVMRAGRVEQMGAPLDLFDRPANRFVASFLGSPAMNFLDGTIGEGGLFRGNGGLSIATHLVRHDGEGRRVSLGIRPEHFRLDDQGLPLSVKVVEPTGTETHIVGTLGGTELVAVLKQRLDIRPGEKLNVGFDPLNVHVFDQDTGIRI